MTWAIGRRSNRTKPTNSLVEIFFLVTDITISEFIHRQNALSQVRNRQMYHHNIQLPWSQQTAQAHCNSPSHCLDDVQLCSSSLHTIFMPHAWVVTSHPNYSSGTTTNQATGCRIDAFLSEIALRAVEIARQNLSKMSWNLFKRTKNIT